MQYLIPEKREKPCSKEREMYRKTCQTKELPEIGLYFAGRLNPENRWVKMADLVPREEVESCKSDRAIFLEIMPEKLGALLASLYS